MNGGPEFDFWMRKGVIHVHHDDANQDVVVWHWRWCLFYETCWEVKRGARTEGQNECICGGPGASIIGTKKRGYTSIATTPIIRIISHEWSALSVPQVFYLLLVPSLAAIRLFLPVMQVDLGRGLYPTWILEFMEPLVTPTILPINHLRWGEGDLQRLALCFAQKNSQESQPSLWWALSCDWQSRIRCLLRKPPRNTWIFYGGQDHLSQSLWANFSSAVKLEHYGAIVTAQRCRLFHVLLFRVRLLAR